MTWCAASARRPTGFFRGQKSSAATGSLRGAARARVPALPVICREAFTQSPAKSKMFFNLFLRYKETDPIKTTKENRRNLLRRSLSKEAPHRVFHPPSSYCKSFDYLWPSQRRAPKSALGKGSSLSSAELCWGKRHFSPWLKDFPEFQGRDLSPSDCCRVMFNLMLIHVALHDLLRSLMELVPSFHPQVSASIWVSVGNAALPPHGLLVFPRPLPRSCYGILWWQMH